MVHYIRQIIDKLLKDCDEVRGGSSGPREDAAINLRAALVEELNRFDPRDFLPEAQFDFVDARAQARKHLDRTPWNPNHHRPLLQRILKLLDKYAGEGSRAETRSFAHISDIKLRGIIERDYKELSLISLPSGAWKGSVVLAGSILEAILHDQLTANPLIKGRALASRKSLKDKTGKTKEIEDWKLQNLIEVATDIGLLPSERAETFDRVLRDYRNFVHAKAEIRAAHECSEPEALMAKGALDAVCNFLEQKGKPIPC